MKALVFHGPRRLAWEEWPEPEPAPGEAVIAVRAVGICGSDLHGYTGESARRTAPLVMGHEFTGEVLSVPAGTPGIAVGDRVVARPFIHCGECEFCRSGRANLCRARRYIGATMHGAMAERVAVPLDNLLPLAPQTSFALGSLTEPLAVAMHAARQAGELGGKRILVAGGGTIGLLAMIAARELGAAEIAITEPIAARRAIALDLGADAAIDPARPEQRDALREFDVAFDALGIAATFAQALDALRPGGTLVALGGWRTVPVDLARIVVREIAVRGSFNFTPADFVDAKSWLEQRRFAAERLVTTMALAEGASAFEGLVERRIDAVKLVLTNER